MQLLSPRRREVSFLALAATLVVVYAVLRTVDAAQPILNGWTIAVVALALVSPLAGLTVLAAIGPFTEALTATGQIGPTPPLMAALGVSLLVHAWLHRPLPRLPASIAAAAGLFVVTLLGVAYSALTYGTGRGIEALQSWVPGIGGGLTVLLVAAWLAWRGDLRPFIVGVASIGAAALVSLVDFLGRGVVQQSALGWLVREGVDRGRLAGVLDAPNPAAALFVAGLAITLAVVVFERRPALRTVALLASIVLAAAAAATFSRSGVLSLALVTAILAWRWRRAAGIALSVVVGVIGFLIVTGGVVVRIVPSVFDDARVDAWRASIAMWLAAPLAGQGFRSFEWLHDAFGSTLDAPHNEWLRLFAEEGTVGGLIGLAFVATVLVALLRTADWRISATGAAAAAFILMACFNNPLLYVQVTAPVFLVLGSGLGLAIGRVGKPLPEPSAG